MSKDNRKRRDTQTEKRHFEPIDPADRWRVFHRDGCACLNCGDNLDLHVDHAVPKSLGGSNNIYNLQTLCWACNFEQKNFRFKRLCVVCCLLFVEPALATHHLSEVMGIRS